MGVFLSLAMDPARIEPRQWESVFQEVLTLVDAFDLLDRITEERSGARHIFARKSALRELREGELGVLVCGTVASGWHMEDFTLYQDLAHYQSKTSSDDNGVDVLFYQLDPEEGFPESNARGLWFAKTQGQPGHIPLLAVACLLTHRFPEAVTVGGDISAGQCRAAVRLANQYLKEPIQEPVVCRAEALARRLQRTDLSTEKKLEAFFSLYQDALSPETGRALLDVFSQEVVFQFFRSQFAEAEPEEHGFWFTLRDWFLLGLDLASLIRLLCSGPESLLTPEALLSLLLDGKIHLPYEEKECYDPSDMSTAVNGDTETPHTVWGMLGRAFMRMSIGWNRCLPAYVPPEELRKALRTALPELDTDALLERMLAEHTPDEEQEQAYGVGEDSIMGLLNRRMEEVQAEVDEEDEYDMAQPGDLFCYRPGCTFYPPLAEQLRNLVDQVRRFDVEESFSVFLSLDRAGRERSLIQLDKSLLLRESAWEHIFSRIMDDEYIRRYFQLFLVDCSSNSIVEMMEPLLNHPELVDLLWEQGL